jgi:hypothetical protein
MQEESNILSGDIDRFQKNNSSLSSLNIVDGNLVHFQVKLSGQL